MPSKKEWVDAEMVHNDSSNDSVKKLGEVVPRVEKSRWSEMPCIWSRKTWSTERRPHRLDPVLLKGMIKSEAI